MKVSSVARSGIAARYNFELRDDEGVRAACIQRPEKTIICLSSQVGCVGSCVFCSASSRPFVRNLTSEEMVEMVQIIRAREHLDPESDQLISFMGTGEPLANLDNVIQVVWQLRRSHRKFALSASGYSLGDIGRVPVHMKVQFTYVSGLGNLREAMQPYISGLNALSEAVCSYTGPKELNVPLIAGVNDGPIDMDVLAGWAKSRGIGVKLNHLNPVNDFYPSKRESECLARLLEHGVEAELYATDGADVFAACGQFELE